jgi:hypothetical protein
MYHGINYNLPFIGPYNGFFGLEKTSLRYCIGAWQERNGITYLGTCGTLLIGATKENFCSDLQRTGNDGCSGSLRQRSGMDW